MDKKDDAAKVALDPTDAIVERIKKDYFLLKRSTVIGGVIAVCAVLGINVWIAASKVINDAGFSTALQKAESAVQEAQQFANSAGAEAGHAKAAAGEAQVELQKIRARPLWVAGTSEHGKDVAVPYGTSDDWSILVVARAFGYHETQYMDNALLWTVSEGDPLQDKSGFKLNSTSFSKISDREQKEIGETVDYLLIHR